MAKKADRPTAAGPSRARGRDDARPGRSAGDGRPAKVRDTLKDLGLAASKSRGQNFLKDPQQIARIVQAILKEAGRSPDGAPATPPAGDAGTRPPCRIMEIGPGLGALTRPLLEAGAEVRAVELDRGLAENLIENLRPLYPGRLEVAHRDVLSLGEADLADAAPLYLCGNLPYNISSPVLLWHLKHRRFFTGAAFMLQKEMARRLTAETGTKEYGRLTVALSLWFEIREILEVPPSAFHPRPKVDSVVVSLRPRPGDQNRPPDPQALGRLTAAAFAARRKTILNNLGRVYGRLRAEQALAELELDPGLRAENLSPPVLARLALRLEAGE